MMVHSRKSGLILILAALALLALLSTPSLAAANIWFVPDDYPSIQAAIDASAGTTPTVASGDSIVVRAGTYDGNFLVPNGKNFTIMGSGEGVTTLVGRGWIVGGHALIGMSVSGFTFTGEGSGLSLSGAYDPRVIVQATISNNEFIGCSGNAAIEVVVGDPIIEYNDIILNDCTGIYFFDCPLTAGLRPGDREYPYIIGNLIAGNHVFGDGGGVSIGTGDHPPGISEFRVRDNVIVDNVAEGSGGGVFAYSFLPNYTIVSLGELDMFSPVIEGNTAALDGGGVCIRGGAAFSVEVTSPYGYLEMGVNSAGRYGGGIAIMGFGDSRFRQVYFHDCFAGAGGGAAYLAPSPAGSVSMNYCWVNNNEAGSGGGIYLDDQILYVGSNITAPNMGRKCIVRNTTVEYNVASVQGGGISSFSGADIASNYIHANYAANGGAVVLTYDELLRYNYITENTATVEDGGIRIIDAIEPWVMDSEVRDNVAAQGGGGLSIRGTTSFAVVTNNLFEDNYAGSEAGEGVGGGVLVDTDADSYAKIHFNTILGNQVAGPIGGRGAGVFLNVAAPLDFSNNVVVNNFSGGAVYGTAASRPWVYAFNNDLWSNENFEWGGGFGPMTGYNGNISADPKFALGRAGNYYLSQKMAGQSADSPCLNAGSVTAIDGVVANATTRTDHVLDAGVADLGYHYRTQDDDGDGLSNLYELSPGLGSHPWITDHPWAGVDEPYDPLWATDAGWDAVPNLGDYDGLTTRQEYLARSNPQDFDTDADGLSDGDEVLVRHTDPIDPDTDNDGLTDGDEVNVYHTNPIAANTGVYGFVTRADTGAPIVGATIRLVKSDVITTTVLSDSSGAYHADASTGTYEVLCNKVGYAAQDVPDVVVQGGKVTILNFAMEEATGIAGTVRSAADGSTLSGVTVELSQDEVVMYSGISDAGGNYGMEVDAGTYDVTCSRSGYDPQTQTGVVIPVDTLVVVDFLLQPVTGLTGRVTVAGTGAPIADAAITLLQGGVEIYSTTTGPDGYYSVETDAGTYVVTCSALGYVDQTRTGVVISSSLLTTANFALAKSARITGTVTRALDGEPVGGAEVRLYARLTGVLLYSATTADDGTYAIERNLASGAVSIEVSATGYLTKASVVTLIAGQSYILDFALSSLPTRVEGRITRTGGVTGVSGARIAAYLGGLPCASATANSLGGYSITLPGPGDYWFLVTATSYLRQEADITLGIGERVTRDFVLDRFSGSPIALSGEDVSPPEGPVGTGFTYTVTYAHEWGRPAVRAYLYIDGRGRSMTRVPGGDTFLGITYQYTTTALRAGTHKYNFVFNDGRVSRRYPVTGYFMGPLVTVTTSLSSGSGTTSTSGTSGTGTTSGSSTTQTAGAITLSAAQVTPSEGVAGTLFNYNVTYMQSAGAPATRAYIYIDGRASSMTLISGDPKTGAVYGYSVSGLDADTHKYNFYFSDGVSGAKLPALGSLSGPVVLK